MTERQKQTLTPNLNNTSTIELFATDEEEIKHRMKEKSRLSNTKYEVNTLLVNHLGPGEAIMISYLIKLEESVFLGCPTEKLDEEGRISYNKAHSLEITKETGLSAKQQQKILKSLTQQRIITCSSLVENPETPEREYKIKIDRSAVMCELLLW